MSHYLDALLAVDPPAPHPNKPKQPDRSGLLGLLGAPQGISTEKNQLTSKERQSILSWLKTIEETDPVVIAEVLKRCAINPKARDYFLWRCGLGSEPET